MIVIPVVGLVAISVVRPVFGAPPSVTLDGATFVGSTSGAISQFLGIPYAQPPTGDSRFRLPVTVQYTNGTTNNAMSFGPSCPQQAPRLAIPPGVSSTVANFLNDVSFRSPLPDSEDCLTVNVVMPASIPAGQILPVVVWIHGGSFQFGASSLYDGSSIVQRSIDLGTPIIYVSMNYRLSLFGFLPGQEVKDAGVGNLGLQDQREAFRWVQKYISQFGGDISKVTIWGEDAGAMSVSLHMITNGGNTEGLFRGGFMQSGALPSVGDITNGQRYYDAVVGQTGCASASDTLACLRTVDFQTLHAAMDSSPSVTSFQSLALAWLPRTDGVFLTDTPQKLVTQGSVARIPIVTGNCDDEGTIYSLSSVNLTTEANVHDYVKSSYFPMATDDEISVLLNVYPSDITQGSPYNTGIQNALTPQFKRLASIQGDLAFQALRRTFINQLAGNQNIWVFLSKRFKTTPFLGSAHTLDLLNIYGGQELRDYLVNFVNTLDPNGGAVLFWPQWDPNGLGSLTFQDNSIFPSSVNQDNYRQSAMNVMAQLLLKFPM